MNLVLWTLSALILSLTQVYTWYKISNKKFQLVNIKNICSIVILALFSMANFSSINPFVKTSIMFLMALLFCRITTKERIKNVIIIVVINYLILIFVEAIFGILITIAAMFNNGNNLQELFDKYNGTIIVNIIISLMMFIICNVIKVNKIYQFINKHATFLKEIELFTYLFTAIICSIIGFTLVYYVQNILLIIIYNIGVTTLYTIIIIRTIITKNRFISINSKYNNSIETLQSQESIINDYRVMNHENKNNLLTIKAMTSNKKIIGYINSLLNQKNNMNEKIMQDTLKLPEGGIRGLIYSKMLVMKDNNIKCNLNVDKKITVKTLANINDSDIVDICQILGVFIDNAIEESLLIEKKEIGIDLHYSKEKIIITITNYHNNKIKNSNKNITIKTTKGKGRGYGLQLVKRIVTENKRLNNTREIMKDTFTQKLEIKL